MAKCYGDLVQELWSGTQKNIAPLKLRVSLRCVLFKSRKEEFLKIAENLMHFFSVLTALVLGLKSVSP